MDTYLSTEGSIRDAALSSSAHNYRLHFKFNIWLKHAGNWGLYVFAGICVFHILLFTTLSPIYYHITLLVCRESLAGAGQVSGFYGPGAFAAWIVTYVSVMRSCEWRWVSNAIAQDLRILQHEENVEVKLIGTDVNFWLVFAYHMIAIFDFLRHPVGAVGSAHRDAAACVFQLGSFLAILALTGSLKSPTAFNGIKAYPSFRRTAVWLSIIVSGHFAMILRLMVDGYLMLDTGVLSSKFFLAMGELSRCFIPFAAGTWHIMVHISQTEDTLHVPGTASGVVVISCFVLSILCFLIELMAAGGMRSAKEPPQCQTKLMFAIPRSGSNLTDLDQAFAFGFAILHETAPLTPYFLRLLRQGLLGITRQARQYRIRNRWHTIQNDTWPLRNQAIQP